VGISSSYHIAKFFGIAVAHAQAEDASVQTNLKLSSDRREAEEPVLQGEVLDNDDESIQPEAAPTLPDIGAIINRALRAAGLVKE
jgi:hypothetical protein